MDEIVGLVPAAGSGTRLYPFARAVPKEMYPVLGKAVIEHCIENLRIGGIKNIHVIVGHQKGALMDYIGDGSFYGVNVSYIYQLKRLGLGHAILQAKNWINKPFVTLLGDSFIEPKEEIRDMINIHTQKKPIATVLLFEVDNPSGYGIVKLKDVANRCGIVERMIEKPSEDVQNEYRTDGKFLAICGAYVFEPNIFEYIERTSPGARNEIQITDAIELARKNGETVFGVILKGQYLDVGKWHTIFKIEKDMLQKADLESHIKERESMNDKIKSHENESDR